MKVHVKIIILKRIRYVRHQVCCDDRRGLYNNKNYVFVQITVYFHKVFCHQQLSNTIVKR